MKLVSFSTGDGKIRPGALIEEAKLVVDLAAPGQADALGVIAAGVTAVGKPGAYPGYKLSEVRLHAPLANPPRVFAIGLNYRDHASGIEDDAAQGAGGFLQDDYGDYRARREHCAAQEFNAARLRGGVCFCYRQGRLPDSGIGVARTRLRLHHRQRRERARCAAFHVAVVAGQELSDFLPDGAGHRDRGRDRRPA